jgi:hypothetical protein
MYQAGFKTIHDFLNADYDDFMGVPGIRSTLANKFYNEISTKMRAADLANVAANSGFFGTAIGSKKIQAVIDEYFQPFVSGSKACGSGLGLGLYIVKNIIAQHGLEVIYRYEDGLHQFSIDFAKGCVA